MLPEPAAAALPAAPEPEPPTQADERQVLLTFGERRYRVRGLPKQLTEALKVNVLVTVAGETRRTARCTWIRWICIRPSSARRSRGWRPRSSSSRRASCSGTWVACCSSSNRLIEERAKAAESPIAAPAAMTSAERDEALAFLRDPALIERILQDVERVGLVGEPSNALVAYLACVSRKLAAPLALLIQSTSAAGKSTLMDACWPWCRRKTGCATRP